MKLRRGDVVLVLFPNSDLQTAKRRPALGLRLDSVVMTDNLATVLETELDSKLGSLPEMSAVDAALKHTLALA